MAAVVRESAHEQPGVLGMGFYSDGAVSVVRVGTVVETEGMMEAQQPKCSMGTRVHVGDWSGEVIAIDRDGVLLRLDNGRVMRVARKLIEEAVS